MSQKSNGLPQGARPKMDYDMSSTSVCASLSTPMQPGTSTSSSRIEPLEEALRLTTGDRQNSYGHPTDDFFRTAGLWTSLLGLPPGTITPEKVALMMVLLKISREMNRHKMDNLVDMAGYVNCLNMIYKRRELLEPCAAAAGPSVPSETMLQAMKRLAASQLQNVQLNPVHDYHTDKNEENI